MGRKLEKMQVAITMCPRTPLRAIKVEGTDIIDKLKEQDVVIGYNNFLAAKVKDAPYIVGIMQDDNTNFGYMGIVTGRFYERNEPYIFDLDFNVLQKLNQFQTTMFNNVMVTNKTYGTDFREEVMIGDGQITDTNLIIPVMRTYINPRTDKKTGNKTLQDVLIDLYKPLE